MNRMPMEAEARTTGTVPRWLFWIAGTLLVAYGVNVGLRIAAVKFGAAPWRLGDLGEFLLVLVGMAFFVAALVIDEERQEAPVDEMVDSNPMQGGVS
jgi:hypothetical protein